MKHFVFSWEQIYRYFNLPESFILKCSWKPLFWCKLFGAVLGGKMSKKSVLTLVWWQIVHQLMFSISFPPWFFILTTYVLLRVQRLVGLVQVRRFYKISSVCLTPACPSLFTQLLFQKWLTPFTLFLHECKILWELKTDRAGSSKKTLIDPILDKKGQKWPQNGVFCNFWKCYS